MPYTKAKDLCELEDGRLVLREVTEPKGFWQYLPEGREDLHPSFWLHRTVTGRSASSDPNGQNIPKRGDLAKAFRKVFKPRPGWKFLSADYSQIELRLAAWTAREPTMIEVYATGGDIHCATASNAIGVDIGEFITWKDSDEPYDRARFGNFSGTDLHTMKDFYEMMRYRAKGFNFGLVYGQWWTGLQTYMKTGYGVTLTDHEAQSSRQRFFDKFKGLDQWHWDMKKFAQQHEYVRSLHGALRRLPSIGSDDEGVVGEAKRQGINSPIQRFASDLGVMAMARFNRDAPREYFQLCGFIHDDIITQFDPERIDVREAASYLKFYMESNPLMRWFGVQAPLPIVADPSGPGDNLAEMGDLSGITPVAPPWYQARFDE
jgi:DNA polymerase I-like protein with 3'-5' exonuclease and polymerase domains